MAKFVHHGESIECMASDVVSRKILPSAYIEILSIGKCMTYKCKLNSEAIITKELPHPVNGKRTGIKSATSKLNLHDKIECEDILLAVTERKRLKPSKVAFTGRHNSQYVSTKCYTYAEISLQFSNIPLKANLINIQPNILLG
jgi:hypothetical protein